MESLTDVCAQGGEPGCARRLAVSVRIGDAALTSEGRSTAQGPLEMHPCLDSITVKVFYFLQHLDQRTLF